MTAKTDETAMDIAYANSRFIPGGEGYPARWAAAATQFRAALGPRAQTGLRYGAGTRQTFDLFLPEGVPQGLLVFVHGGYWRAFAPADWSHLAAGGLARGWAVALPGYTLAPEARIAQITREVAVALVAAAGRVPGPVVVAGHSAGGHLAARMACADILLPVAARLTRAVPISPLSDLRPLMQTAMNADFRMDAASAMAESPMLHPRRAGTAVHVWVGGAERPAFLDQARWLAEAWDTPLTVEAERHHFDVVEGLEDADSGLMRVLLG